MTYITQLTRRKAMFGSRILTMALAGFVLVVLQSSTVHAQWSNGTNINNTNNGTVSIGTTNPGGDKLIIAGNTVSGNITSHTQLYSNYNTQNNVIMELGYGTATSADTPLPSLVLSKNLTGANNLLGSIQFANRNIADGSEKRLAQVAAWTNGATNSGALLFSTTGAGSLVERMRITSGGNVGIGTTSPSAGLDIQTPITAVTAYGVRLQQTLTAGFNNAQLSGLYINPTFVDGVDVGVIHNALVTGGGSVGIGTAATSAGLDVQNVGIAASGSTFGTRVQQVLPSAGNYAVSTAVYVNPTFNDGQAVGVRHNGLVVASGNVGIGTSATSAGLDVQNVGIADSGSTFGTRVQQVLPSAGNNGVSTAVYINPTFSDGQAIGVRHNGLVVASGDVGIGTSTPSTKLHVVGDGTITGNLTVTGNIAAKYQDVAEWVQSSQELPAGTVVVLDQTRSNQVIASTQAYDTRVAGVISFQPGIALGENGAGKVLVATTGRVRIKVDASRGSIQVGDLLVTSDLAGVAMKSQPIDLGGVQIHRPGTLIGKALEPLEKGVGEILVLLSLQ